MTAPVRRAGARRGVVYWARAQMRGLDRWTSKAILFICFAGIIVHGLVGH